MNTPRGRLIALVALVLLALGLQACETTSHRIIRQGFQADGDRVKFLYEEVPGFERGIIECHVDDHGELYDCHELGIVFRTGEEEL